MMRLLPSILVLLSVLASTAAEDPALTYPADGNEVDGEDIAEELEDEFSDAFTYEERSWQESPFLANPAVMLDAMMIPMNCGMDGSEFQQWGLDTYEDGPSDSLMHYLQNVGRECTNEEATSFNGGLDEFKTCAGFDLSAFVENIPSALVGVVLECALTTDWSAVSDWSDPSMLSNLQFSERCLNMELGDNGFGNALRYMWLYPDRVFPCFAALSEAVPLCTMDTWPIPLVGKWLSQMSCAVGGMSKLIHTGATIEMGIWKKCLPESGCDNDCQQQGSLFVRNSGAGIPASDVMKRIAGERPGMDDVLARYENYVSSCTPPWEGWSRVAHPDGTPAIDLMSSSSPETPAGAASSGGNASLFFGGMVAGAILVGLAMVLTRKKQATKTAYNTVELSTGGEYTDDAELT